MTTILVYLIICFLTFFGLNLKTHVPRAQAHGGNFVTGLRRQFSGASVKAVWSVERGNCRPAEKPPETEAFAYFDWQRHATKATDG